MPPDRARVRGERQNTASTATRISGLPAGHLCARSGKAGGIALASADDGAASNKGRRFAMWSLLYMLGSAPDLDTAFEDAGDRDAARRFMDLLDEVNAGEDN